MRTILSLYNYKLPVYLIYMLQQVEYEPNKLLSWFARLLETWKPIDGVMKRQRLVKTRRAKAILLATYGFAFALVLGYVWYFSQFMYWAICLAAILLVLPIFVFWFVYILAVTAHVLVVGPQKKRLLEEAEEIFKKHKGIKIAVLGSYGKTTMKEILTTVLSEGKIVASTPGNMNVSVSHARFAKTLKGDEQVLIVEFGEGEPGDIARMAGMLKPNYAVLTGLAPNHLDHYTDLDAVAADLLSIYDYVDKDKVFVTAESSMLKPYLPNNVELFSQTSFKEWKISNVKTAVDSLAFSLKKGKSSLKIHSGLIGWHQVAPLALVAAVADELGLKKKEIERGVARIAPFEHRMQPRFVHGAWLIDDTYNGNLEGMKAGLNLLAEIKAKRSWYVTPGLVDQGAETERVHTELGEAIAKAKPDIVVLMDNSARITIESALKKGGYSGELRIETEPLEFYLNIEHIVAAGDVVLMQNDWTDNYH